MTGAVLTAAGTVTGALVGLMLGLMMAFVAPLPTAGSVLPIALIGAALVLDALVLLVGVPKPPGSGRQVPQEWSRLFDPRIVAMLYGARLGVGPLTILSTWTWWAVTVAAALVGPGTSVAVGAAFGFVRMAVTIGASLLSSAGPASESVGEPLRHAAWFGRLRARQRPNWFAINGAGMLLVALIALAGCGQDRSAAEAGPDTTAQETGPTSAPMEKNKPGAATDRAIDPAIDPVIDPVIDVSAESSKPALITPVELEDVVRSAVEKNLVADPNAGTDGGAGDGVRIVSDEAEILVGESQTLTDQNATADGPDTGGGTFSSDPDALSTTLMATIDGFQPVDDPLANRFLDIVAASELQPDPTEEIALLETRGFEGGWTRAFRNDRNDVAVTSVYQFRNAAEAEFYLEDGLITIGGYGGKFFDIDGLPGVRGFVQYFTDDGADGGQTDGPDADGAQTNSAAVEELVSLGAAFQVGPRWYLVYFVGSVDSVTPEVLVPAITAQKEAV